MKAEFNLGNIAPKKFGKGNLAQIDWECKGCGHINRRYLVQCGMCGVHRKYTDPIGETE